MRFLALFFLSLLAVPLLAQPEGVTVRAIWSPDTFVIINISDEGTDLTELRFESALGELTPEDWQMQADPNSGAIYTLDDVRPGSCLVAAFGTTTPELPSGVNCTRIIGVSVVTTLDDIIWSVDQGGFTPYIDDDDLAECSIRRTSCDIAAPPANAPERPGGEEAEDTVETVTIRAVWTEDIFVLLNNTDQGVDLSALTLESEMGSITPDDWAMEFSPDLEANFALADFRPGSCLLAYLDDGERPDLPQNVTCTRIAGRYLIIDMGNRLWDASQERFTPFVDNVPGTACPVDVSSCDLVVPVTAPQELVQVRAVWNETVFVIMNSSSSTVDLSGLVLRGRTGAIEQDDWVLRGSRSLASIAPEDCLVAFTQGRRADDVALPLPEGMRCNIIVGEYAVAPGPEVIWTDAETFTPILNDRPEDDCFIEDGVCDIAVPRQS